MKITFFLIAVMISCSVYCQEDSANSFHQGGEHTGIYTLKNYASFGNVLMKFKTKGKIFSSPLIRKGYVYIGSGDGNLNAINIHHPYIYVSSFCYAPVN